nr:MAG TPA: hypothetical protein [Caudoviricetes sp.]
MLRPASGIKDSPGLVGRPKRRRGSIPPEGARPQRGACCTANSIVETPNCPFLVRGGHLTRGLKRAPVRLMLR